jgi:hypothetical protein
VRAWLRYVVPATLLGCIACAPLVLFALRVAAPADVAAAQRAVRAAWIIAGAAIACELWLVSAVAPAVASVAAGSPLAQPAALVAGARNLVRGFVPWVVCVVAVLLGGAALVVPGVLLAILMSLTGASRELPRGAQAAIADSIATVRPRLARVGLVVVAIVGVQLAVTGALQLALLPALAKTMSAARLAPVRTYVRAVAIAVVALAPLAACALATVYSQAQAERR